MFTRDTIRFGIIAGLIPLLSMLAGNLFGWYDDAPRRLQAVIFNASTFGMLLCILAVLTRRRKSLGPGEILSFKGGVRSGAGVVLIAAVGIALSIPLYMDVLDPAWRDQMAVYAQKQMTAEHLKQSEIEAQVKAIRESSSMFYLLRFTFFALMTGLLQSGVGAFVIRTMPPAHPAE